MLECFTNSCPGFWGVLLGFVSVLTGFVIAAIFDSFKPQWGQSRNYYVEKGELDKRPLKKFILTYTPVVATIAMLAFSAMIMFSPCTFSEEKFSDIYTLEDTSLINGAFVLGTGSVEGEPVYAFYSKSGEAYYLGWVRAKNTAIYMDSGDNPYLKTTSGCCGSKVYEFHVPSNTITHHYNLDAKL